jgi:phage shock protein C
MNQVKRLYRSNYNRVIGGVCQGMANYFNLDVSLMRIAWVIFAFFGAGVLAYIICWIVIPESPYGT